MGEHNFTYHFKNNLAYWLQDYFDDCEIGLEVETEHRKYVGNIENRIDIGILDPEKDDLFIGIEIEYISNRDQIFRNYNNFKNWVHSSQNRKGGLLHIISYESDLSRKDLWEILYQSYNDTSKALDFFYEFLKLEESDLRKHDKLAKSLVYDDWEFDARFCSLILKVFGKKYIDYL